MLQKNGLLIQYECHYKNFCHIYWTSRVDNKYKWIDFYPKTMGIWDGVKWRRAGSTWTAPINCFHTLFFFTYWGTIRKGGPTGWTSWCVLEWGGDTIPPQPKKLCSSLSLRIDWGSRGPRVVLPYPPQAPPLSRVRNTQKYQFYVFILIELQYNHQASYFLSYWMKSFMYAARFGPKVPLPKERK